MGRARAHHPCIDFARPKERGLERHEPTLKAYCV
jgi:hypothetical protein